MRLFTTPNRDAGFALKGDDIVSVFKHPAATHKNVTKSMLSLAVNQGGRRLDAFDTVLPHLYAQSGFRAVSRLPFNDEYAPPGWNRDTFKEFNGGRPDVVHMVHDPQAGAYQPWDGARITDYDHGEQLQRQALAGIDARGNVPATPGPEAYGSGQLIRMSDPLTVHHGTPHEFAPTRANPLGEFLMSKIGTGEGNQSYGHGPYLAGNEKVADGYREDLSEGTLYQGKPIPYSRTDPTIGAVHAVGEYIRDLKMTPEKAMETVAEEYRDAAASAHFSTSPQAGVSMTAAEANRRRMQFYLGVAHAVQRLKPEDFSTDNSGNLYQAELHIHPDHMLDWDRPLSEQAPYIHQQLAAHGIVHPDDSHMTGLAVHNALLGLHDTADQSHAARALLGAGIPGIRYADAGSRMALEDVRRGESKLAMMRAFGAPERDIAVEAARLAQDRARVSHNYVVFDPRTINITKRNGLPAMVDAGADALRDHKAGV